MRHLALVSLISVAIGVGAATLAQNAAATKKADPWGSGKCWPLIYVDGRAVNKWCHFEGWKWECRMYNIGESSEFTKCERRDALTAEEQTL